MANVTITELPQAGAITGTEAVPIVQNGQTVQTTASALAGSPIQTQTFITLNQEPTLANSRALSSGTGVGLVDGGAQAALQITLNAASGSLETAGTGLIAKTASNAVTARSITVSGSGLGISDGNGVSGNPTLALTGLPSSLANLSGSGFLYLPNTGTVNAATLTGTASQITVTGGDGTSGNPIFSIATDPQLPGTGGVGLPAGGTAARPVSPYNGLFRYNSDTGLLEAYLSSTWTSLAAGSGVTSVATGTGLTGGPIVSTGTISIANTAVSAGSYTAANITVNAQGQITAAASNSSLVTSFSAGSTGLTPSTATTGAVTLAGTLAVANGGTGQASTLTQYGVVYGSTTTAMASTAAGTATTLLHGNASGAPSFSAVSLTADVSGTLPVANGGTGLTAGTSGGILAYTATGTLASSALLTQYGVVYGGGAGAAPVSTAAGTTGQVLTATTGGAPTWATPSGSGTVTSVGFTGGIITVASPTTTPAFTVAGTSGGVVYFSSASTWATSAALAASAIVIGGGAGVAPSTTTTGTGVVTALGVNTGTAGAFVVNGGALGTPSSGTVTNLTGTASININGTVGATTATTGAFTTVTATTGIFGGTF